MRNSITITLFIVTLIITGCSGKVSLTGKVTFSDNNEPLPKGVIFFEKGNSMAHATIQSDGTYVAGSVSKTDGIQKGEYGVRITLSDVREAGHKHDPTSGKPDRRVRLIDPKYEKTSASGLRVNVEGATVYNISVDRCPPEKAKFKE